jgi:aminopeptidase
VAAASVPAWAQLIFPDKPEKEAVDKLWEAIFTTTRLDAQDPVEAWREHISDLEIRAAYLTNKQYRSLQYRAEGTDLQLGLADNHVWCGGGSTTPAGISFAPNMPTEEVFCAPHKDRVDGVVQSSKPLSYGGKIIEGFKLEFKAGRVTAVHAGRHQAILEKLISIDEGARRLGEVALVPHSSPISQTGLLFYNTLLDENAACHLALGEAYKDCVKGGSTMSTEDFKAHGGNVSMTHVDFMVGSNALDIDGIQYDGSKEAVMRSGEWAFDV